MRRGWVSQTAWARLAYVALFAAIGAAVPYLPVYYERLGFDLDQIGLFAALGAGLSLLGAPAWGAVADRFSGSRLVLPAAAGGAAVAATALAYAESLTAVLVIVVALSLTFAGAAPILDARAVEIAGSDRNRYGRLRAWGSASFIVAAGLVGALIDAVGPRGLFAAYVPLLLATGAVALWLEPPRLKPRLPRFASLRLVLAEPALRRFLPAALLTWASATAVYSFFSIHVLALGAPAGLVGIAWGIGALVEIPIMWAFPALATRVGVERLLPLGAACFALRALALAVVDDPILAVMTMVLAGTGFALLLVGGVTYVARHAPIGAEATAQGVLSATVFGLAAILGAGLGGLLAEARDLPTMFAVSAIGGVIGIVWLGREAVPDRPLDSAPVPPS